MRRLRWVGMGALALIGACTPPPSPPLPSPQPGLAEPAAPVAPPTVATPSLLEVRAPELLARFGEPAQRRRDGGAEVWVYEVAGTCRLNLVLQRDRGTQSVVHAQARLVPPASVAVCLDGLGRR